MLHWKVCWGREPIRDCDCVHHRKRRRDKSILGIVLIVAAVLVLLCVLPLWVIIVLTCAVLLALGIVWLVI